MNKIELQRQLENRDKYISTLTKHINELQKRVDDLRNDAPLRRYSTIASFGMGSTVNDTVEAKDATEAYSKAFERLGANAKQNGLKEILVKEVL